MTTKGKTIEARLAAVEKALAKLQAGGSITAMAVVLKNVASHNWGWFSNDDERIHLQTVDPKSLKQGVTAKFWLEKRGERVFELAAGSLSASDKKKLLAQVRKDQELIENSWVHWLIEKDWLLASLDGSMVTLTVYPDSHNTYKRTIDMRKELPGRWKKGGTWDANPSLARARLDEELGVLAVGTKGTPQDGWAHFQLAPFIFSGSR